MLDDMRRGWKKEAKARCHEIVERTADGHMVSDEDAAFLRWLLDRHPCAADKIGVGVAGFTVEAIGMATRGFMLHRFDGSSMAVSTPSISECYSQAVRTSRTTSASLPRVR